MKKKFRLTGLILFFAAFTMMVSCTKDETNETEHYEWTLEFRRQ